jgi:hypothetical protein
LFACLAEADQECAEGEGGCEPEAGVAGEPAVTWFAGGEHGPGEREHDAADLGGCDVFAAADGDEDRQ